MWLQRSRSDGANRKLGSGQVLIVLELEDIDGGSCNARRQLQGRINLACKHSNTKRHRLEGEKVQYLGARIFQHRIRLVSRIAQQARGNDDRHADEIGEQERAVGIARGIQRAAQEAERGTGKLTAFGPATVTCTARSSSLHTQVT